MNLDLDKGGRAAIERMIDAYGCGTKTALAELLGISKGTLSNRYLRDTFPADYVIQCSLDTGVSLKWLATGLGAMFNDISQDVVSIPRKKLIQGELFDANLYLFDKAILPKDIKKPVAILDENTIHITESDFTQITDGEWVINIDKKISIRKIALLPKAKVKVSNSENTFECSIEDIGYISKVRATYINKG
ncbi:phage repressor protein CI [Serratia marcescens]|uniref:phage repressor protein CI n=1 Tax=Serratia TaxID=613 RepID=UPI0006505953|nr:phage repressor protein CI [Serratia marcescens]AWC69318.1 phage repressor protein [Serratia marcescens]AWC91728.1 phage repressor protein [Serratia marcescens]AWS60540.1 phage repressor protein [Serratia marcescens]AWS67438.1 phage repressor protein [Serratia marcescens]ELX7487089.1 phage repressor protein CI [Serratia marcescens]